MAEDILKSPETLDFIHWVNTKKEFAVGEAKAKFKQMNASSILNLLSNLRKHGYIETEGRRGEYTVCKPCPDDANLGKKSKQFQHIF